MKVGIIGAMEQEVTILKEAMTNCQTVNKAGCTFFSGQINDVDVVLLQSGIGKLLRQLVQQFFLMNTNQMWLSTQVLLVVSIQA